ncbi:peptidylprolyl isomerase [Winogradskya consettensis]|uniref:Peptidyl-prolyl cis-trans isomerase (Rotamase) n=1 Tax=Winogradskya consettensis TaxID=113560 RepID=A0A919VKG5_9ACTN|nr:peptidylprolyl isomerase [Actinoplanes consettensis]GIM66255.1 peptidyl-prolyl cis-trans isomerase (rotamase) [Actinoplanes consettensis]
MASSKDRQRKLARDKFDRQMARRAVKQRRRRQIQAGVGAAVALIVIIGGVAWLGGAFDGDETNTDAANSDICAWTPQSTESNKSLKDVGEPPTTGIPTSGTRAMTLTTDQGDPIVVTLDLADAPCNSADLGYLASKQFYDNTTCHEITADGAIRCGDPTATGQGGPTYSIYNENVPLAPSSSASPAPTAAAPLYPKGTVAMIGDPPGTNGSQFLIFFKDFTTADPEYSIVGQVTGGLDTVTKISKIPTVANAAGDKVTPKTKIAVKSVTVGEFTPEGGASPAAAPSASSQS